MWAKQEETGGERGEGGRACEREVPPARTGGYRQCAGAGLAGGRWGSVPAWRLAAGPPLLVRRRGDDRGCTPPLPAAGRPDCPSPRPAPAPPSACLPATGKRSGTATGVKGDGRGGEHGEKEARGRARRRRTYGVAGVHARRRVGRAKTQGRAPAPPSPIYQRQTGAAQTANPPHAGGPAAAATAAVTATNGRTARAADGPARPRPPAGLHPPTPTGRGGGASGPRHSWADGRGGRPPPPGRPAARRTPQRAAWR